MNFYDILGVKTTATKQEIRKAYYKLVLIYHPDKILNKPPDLDISKNFRDIHTAYEILSDDNKRAQYDKLSSEEKTEIYDLIKKYFTDIKPQYSHIYNSLISFLYNSDENLFKNDINDFNIKNLFNRFISGLSRKRYQAQLSKFNYIKSNINFIRENNQFIGTIYTSLRDKYENKISEISIKFDPDLEEKKYLVPLSEPEFHISENNHQIIIHILTGEDNIFDNTDKFIQMNNYDLLLIKEISLYQYIYGGHILINHLDSEKINFEFASCLEKKPIFISVGKGLPINTGKYLLNIINHNSDKKLDRGDLYIYLIIQGINPVDNSEISQEYSKSIKKTIFELFPPL